MREVSATEMCLTIRHHGGAAGHKSPARVTCKELPPACARRPTCACVSAHTDYNRPCSKVEGQIHVEHGPATQPRARSVMSSCAA